MEELVSVKSFDGTIIRIPKSLVDKYLIKQEKIKDKLKNGTSLEEISNLIRSNQL